MTLQESTFYTHMWGLAEVSGIFFTVLRVYGPILRHSNGTPIMRIVGSLLHDSKDYGTLDHKHTT